MLRTQPSEMLCFTIVRCHSSRPQLPLDDLHRDAAGLRRHLQRLVVIQRRVVAVLALARPAEHAHQHVVAKVLEHLLARRVELLLVGALGQQLLASRDQVLLDLAQNLLKDVALQHARRAQLLLDVGQLDQAVGQRLAQDLVAGVASAAEQGIVSHLHSVFAELGDVAVEILPLVVHREDGPALLAKLAADLETAALLEVDIHGDHIPPAPPSRT
eukprot:4582433-Pleurochrysis_carterae.AAC.1